MARYAITQQLALLEQLAGFDSAGYAFDAAASDPTRLVFRRSVGYQD